MRSLLLSILIIGFAPGLMAQTTVYPGDIVIVGYNADNSPPCGGINSNDDLLYWSCFKNIESGTILYITDNGYEATTCGSNTWGELEGVYRITYNGPTIAAGTVILWKLSASLVDGFNVENMGTGWTKDTVTGFNEICNLTTGGGDQLYFTQGGSWTNPEGVNNATYTGGRVVYGLNKKSTWGCNLTVKFDSGLHPEIIPCAHIEPSSGGSLHYIHYIGPMTATDQLTWLERIGDWDNWTYNFSCEGFNADFAITSLPINTSIITLSASPESGCSPETSTLTFTLPDAGGPFSVVYTDGTTDYTLTNISDGHSIMVNFGQPTTYSIESITGASGCTLNMEGADASDITLNLGGFPYTTPNPASLPNICEGQNATLATIASGGNATSSVGDTLTGLSLAIPNNSLTGVSSSITLEGSGTISSTNTITVLLNINHTSDADLDVFLVGPGNCGTMMLTTDNGGTGDNYTNTFFSTSASNIIGTGGNNTAPFTGTFRPEGTITTVPVLNSGTGGGSYTLPATALNGCNVSGTWTLWAYDDAIGNSGTVTSWGLNISSSNNYTSSFYGGTGTIGSVSYSGSANANATVIVTAPAVGVNTFYVTSSYTGCTSNPEAITLKVFDIPNITSAPVTTNGSTGTMTVIASINNANFTGGDIGTIEYSLAQNGPWQVSNVFTGLLAGTYNVYVRNSAKVSCVSAPYTVIYTTPCNNPPASVNPCSAPVICDGSSIDLYCGGTISAAPVVAPSPFCGAPNNNQFIAFVAGSNMLSIQFNVDLSSCTGTPDGTGLQAEIYSTTNCATGSAYSSVSNCFSQNSGSGVLLTATGLNIGQTYYLMVDGWSGDICNYSLDLISGTIGILPSSPNVPSGLSTICQGTSATYSVSGPTGLTYQWTVNGGGASINGSSTGTSISVSFPPAANPYDVSICVRAVSACGESDYTCRIVSTYNVDSQSPILVSSLPGPITVSCSLPAPVSLTFTDNCQGTFSVLSVDNTSGYTACGGGTVIRSWTASDNSGNTTVVTQTITALPDLTAPTFNITMPNDLTVACTVNYNPLVLTTQNVSDNCGGTVDIGFTTTISYNVTCPAIYQKTYTWTLTDVCGNVRTHIQLVTFTDQTGSSMSCPASILVNCSFAEQPAYFTLSQFIAAGGTATDNCLLDTSSFVMQSQIANSSVVIRTYAVSDFCNSASTCEHFIIIGENGNISAGDDQTICSGQSATLIASGGTTYEWSNGLGNMASVSTPPLTSSTTYTVTATNSSCTATDQVIVNVVNVPIASPQSNSPVLIGSAINLTSNFIAGASYLWTGPNGFSSTLQNPSILNATETATGNYTLIITLGTCSSAPATISVTVNSNCQSLWYQDNDGDGQGNPAVSLTACTAPSGYVSNNLDCDDNNATACPVPSAPSTTSITDISAMANWTGTGCAQRYQFQYKRKVDVTWNYVVLAANTSNYTISNLLPGTKYQWRMNSVCDTVSNVVSALTTVQNFTTKYRVYPDTDLDGYGNNAASSVLVATFPLAGYSLNNTDCNDSNNAIHPGVAEICNNNLDDDCDGLTDGSDPDIFVSTWYQDNDGDGKGNPAVSQVACSQPVGYVANNLDCDDTSAAVCPTPAAPGTSAIIDVSATVSWTGTSCAQRYTLQYKKKVDASWVYVQLSSNTTSFLLQNLLPGTKYQWRVTTVCDTVGNVVSSPVPVQNFTTKYRVYPDTDGDGYGNLLSAAVFVNSLPAPGYAVNNLDCNDSNGAIFPGGTEICNLADDDCDGLTDEGSPVQTYHQDLDNDGYGNAAVTIQACIVPPGYVSNSTDCNDTNNNISPNAPEICNSGTDDDCDGLADDLDPGITGQTTWYIDSDGDGLGSITTTILTCVPPAGYVGNALDCNDASSSPFCLAPSNLSISGITSNSATLSWVNSPCVSNYAVQYRPNAAGSWLPANPVLVNGNSHLFSGLAPNTLYQYRIRALCSAINVNTPFITGTFTTLPMLLTLTGAGITGTGNADFELYPNPGDGVFNLRMESGGEGSATVMVLDGLGKLVYSTSWALSKGLNVTQLDLSAMANGVYEVQVRFGEMVKSKKLVMVR